VGPFGNKVEPIPRWVMPLTRTQVLHYRLQLFWCDYYAFASGDLHSPMPPVDPSSPPSKTHCPLYQIRSRLNWSSVFLVEAAGTAPASSTSSDCFNNLNLYL